MAMKKIIMAVLLLTLGGAGAAFAQPKPMKIYIAPNSIVPRPEIMKHLVDKCPNVSITLDPKKSDYMLEAWGWSGNYRFTVFQHGGTAVYATSTVMLSNAVKDVCKFVNSPAGQSASANRTAPPPPPATPPAPQHD
jgi:hypothetical protein